MQRLLPDMIRLLMVLEWVLVLGFSWPVWSAEMPRDFVDTNFAIDGAATVQVSAGDDFQRALDKARPGDIIELAAGAVFRGPFILPAKPDTAKTGSGKAGAQWIIIRSEVTTQALPPAGSRVTPANASAMPKLVAPGEPAIRTAPGAHHYRFIGVEFTADDNLKKPRLFSRLRALVSANTGFGDRGTYVKNILLLGEADGSTQDLPHHLVFDRCYFHGDAQAGARRGIAMNSGHTAVINSWFADFKEIGADSQAIAGWNGPGPFSIINNHIEGAGENVMFGGSDPAIDQLVPADIEIRGNHFTKPIAWRRESPGYAGTNWSVKNLFELKNARRVVVDGNLFEYNWPAAQNGFAILFTVRNEDGKTPWAAVEDVHFSNNVLQFVGSGFNILGRDDNGKPSVGTRNIDISNNLILGPGGDWGEGTLLQLLDGVENVAFTDNVALNSGRIIMTEGRAHTGFEFTGNHVIHNNYGIIGTGTGTGKPTLERYFPGASVQNNIFVDAPQAAYPAGNTFPDNDETSLMTAEMNTNELVKTFQQLHEDIAGGFDYQALCMALSVTERNDICLPEIVSR